jgi:hypothetical protein
MSDRILVSTRKGLFTADRSNGDWKVVNGSFVGDNVTLALVDHRDGAWYAALDHGHFGVKLHRSTSSGDTWNEIATPKFPERPPEAKEINAQGIEVPWSTKLVWALEGGGDDREGRLWCGTIPGGLFRSDDRGDSWQLVESLWNDPRRQEWFGGGADMPGIHSVCVHPQRSDHVLVGVSCGGVWLTTDAGASWELRADGMRAAFMPPERAHDPVIQDPHHIVQCRTVPDCYWAQHHNGVFRTTDGSASWTEIEKAGPSTFGFACAVHPDDPDTAWFVPSINDEKRVPVDGNVVVTRTRDGGKSFDVLSDGLPQGFAYDLTFRHALALDRTGRRLVFGSTTGSVWVSEDQGDHWRALSHHLPPVYAVTFVD